VLRERLHLRADLLRSRAAAPSEAGHEREREQLREFRHWNLHSLLGPREPIVTNVRVATGSLQLDLGGRSPYGARAYANSGRRGSKSEGSRFRAFVTRIRPDRDLVKKSVNPGDFAL